MSVHAALSDQDFQKNLAFGQMSETDITRWLISRGGTVMPAYDIEYDTGKGPRVYTNGDQHAVPDLLVWKNGKIFWIEAKRKTRFAWWGKGGYWVTGIDSKHWAAYRNVKILTGLNVWILFYHTGSDPDERSRQMGCPPECPTGLFGQSIEILEACISNTGGHGNYKLTYWACGSLKFMATCEQVQAEISK